MVTIVIITALSPPPSPCFWLQLVFPCWDSCHSIWACTAQQINFHKDVGLSLALPQPSMSLTGFPDFTPTNSATYTSLLPESNLQLQPHWLYLFMTWYCLPPSFSLYHPTYCRCASCLFPTSPLRPPQIYSQSTLNSLSRSDFAL